MGSTAESGETVVVIGSGGRESALAWKLAQSSKVRRVLLVPGNGYTGSSLVDKVSNASFTLSLDSADSFAEFSNWCSKEAVSLVVVGPEGPLAAGLANHLNGNNIPCFGPSREAAELESNKAFAKDFFDRHSIPTARWKSFTDSKAASDFIQAADFNALVVKAAGLAAGKGVLVATTRKETCEAARKILDEKIFGDAGTTIVVEEKLEGPEVSILCFTDGKTVSAMPAAQDAKRLSEGDSGPNTGGMGAYAPVHPSILSRETYDHVVRLIQTVVSELHSEGRSYVGVLYAGIMLTERGPQFLEFNCRFGDPETQAILPLFKDDLFPVLMSCVNGNLSSQPVNYHNDRFVTSVVLAGQGYPDRSDRGTAVNFGKDLKNFAYDENTYVFPAGIAFQGDTFVTNGGRIMSCVGVAETLLQSSVFAQRAASEIQFNGKQRRRDIGYQSLTKSVFETNSLDYKTCDVNIDEGDRFVQDFVGPQAKTTDRVGLHEGVGGFGGLFDLTKLNYREPVLVSGTDGVGTKLLIAEEIGKHETIGIDLVAMSVNDIVTHNAEPMFFLDYFATGKLSAETAGLVMQGIVAGCKDSNCALIGGETAEMPGMYPAGRYDLAGFAVGVAEKSDLMPRPSDINAGDVIIGIPSSGIHSNGYSLVRRVVAGSGIAFSQPAPFNPERSLGDELLIPTKIYVKCLLPALRSGLVKAAAHITGGGLTENIPRILPANVDAILDAQLWPILPVFSWLATQGRVKSAEMARTFNLGIGMILVVEANSADTIIMILAKHGEHALRIGSVVPGNKKTLITGLDSAMWASYHLWGTKYTPPVVRKTRVGIMLSGTGTNMEALVAYTRNPANRSLAEVAVIVSNVGSAAGVEKARNLGIAVEIVDHKKFTKREEYDASVNETLERHNVEVVCLAGYMRICTTVFVGKWRGRCINTHPAILPSFKGKDAVSMALEARVRVSGCTVHFVEEEVDAGGIIMQESVRVFPDDSHDTLLERIKHVEHQIFPRAMEAVCRKDVIRDANGLVSWNENFRNYVNLD